MELFNKTREQIQMDVSRVCSENRERANKGPIKSTSGNLLIDFIKNIIERDGYATTEDILDALRTKGMKHIIKEDLDKLSDPLLLCIGDRWFKREPSRTVYVYAPINIPGATKEKNCLWKCSLDENLVKFYRKNSDQVMILDTDIQRIFDVLYTPAEKMKKELLAELASLYD